MSKTRDASTLAAALGSIAVSFTALAMTPPNFPIGYYGAWFGLFFREMVIIQSSKEGKMIKQKNYPALSVRLVNSTSFRIFQVSPMIGTLALRGFSSITELLVVPSVIILCAVILALIEHYWLWVESEEF